eukprot:1159436-Pelagomonas_calceolata.AAC.8
MHASSIQLFVSFLFRCNTLPKPGTSSKSVCPPLCLTSGPVSTYHYDIKPIHARHEGLKIDATAGINDWKLHEMSLSTQERKFLGCLVLNPRGTYQDHSQMGTNSYATWSSGLCLWTIP